MRLNRVRVIPGRVCVRGVVGMHCAGSASPALRVCGCSGSGLECPAVDGESPVRETLASAIGVLPE